MSNKTEALVRELAALFAKYRLSDWAPIFEELERRGGSDALSEAIRRHVSEVRLPTAATRKPAKKSPSERKAGKSNAATQVELEPRFTGPNAATVEQLRQALVTKTSVPTLQSLKTVFAALGIKYIGSSRREVLISILTDHLDGLDDAGFEKALRAVALAEESSGSDAVADYDRWFKLITARRSNQ